MIDLAFCKLSFPTDMQKIPPSNASRYTVCWHQEGLDGHSCATAHNLAITGIAYACPGDIYNVIHVAEVKGSYIISTISVHLHLVKIL